jgi:hypothetical protein
MSFLKITDPAKRDLLVQELIKTYKNILQDSIDERVGEITALQSLSKLLKPLTEMIETTTQAIKTLLILPAIQAAPPLPAVAPPTPAGSELASHAQAPPSAPPSPPGQQVTTKLGKTSTEYFKLFTTKTKDADTTYGLYDKGSKFYVGDTKIRIQGDDRIVGDRVYEGTPG